MLDSSPNPLFSLSITPPLLLLLYLYSAKVWDAITGTELHTFVHSHIVKTVEFAPDSRRFVSGGHEVGK